MKHTMRHITLLRWYFYTFSTNIIHTFFCIILSRVPTPNTSSNFLFFHVRIISLTTCRRITQCLQIGWNRYLFTSQPNFSSIFQFKWNFYLLFLWLPMSITYTNLSSYVLMLITCTNVYTYIYSGEYGNTLLLYEYLSFSMCTHTHTHTQVYIIRSSLESKVHAFLLPFFIYRTSDISPGFYNVAFVHIVLYDSFRQV